MDLRKLCLCLCLLSQFLCADDISLLFQRMDKEAFQEKVVGNTVVGITRHSQSLYMLYFLEDGSCELWKQNQNYSGHWWIDQDPDGTDLVHAFWPNYISQHSKSLFSPENPSYGKPTSERYYFNLASGQILIAGKSFQTPALLVPGCAFPSAE